MNQALPSSGQPAPYLVVAGLASNSGKTSLTVGLTLALRELGLQVACFKAGPDYLDPSYHSRASGRPCHNLDLWMMGIDACKQTLAEGLQGADIGLIEGVMGLFDGADPTSDAGSTAALARALGAPVLLCIDAAGMARTLAALVAGVQALAPDIELLGVIANRVNSQGHAQLLERALASLPVPVPLLGRLPNQAAPSFPGRHLGLHSAVFGSVQSEALQAWGQAVGETVALPKLLQSVRARALQPRPRRSSGPPPLGAPARRRCRIAVARDAAFHFYYPYNLRALEAASAELVPFSPLEDSALPEGVAGVLIGGGYPEMHGAALAANQAMLQSVREHAAAGGVIYAECGGLMYLSEGVVELQGARHGLVGLIPGWAHMTERIQALGYVEVTTRCAGPLGPAETRLRGHQFRYSKLEGAVEPQHYTLQRLRDGQISTEGYGQGRVWASYVHTHWAHTPGCAESFVRYCMAGSSSPL